MLSIKKKIIQPASVWKDYTISVTKVTLLTSSNFNSNCISVSQRKGRRMETEGYQTFPGYYPILELLQKLETKLHLSRTYRSEKRFLNLLGKDMEHINGFCCQGKI